MNAKVDAFIARQDKWGEEMAELRPILLGAGLTEEIKWGKLCFSHDGHNIAIFQPMKDFLSLMFFKGALLPDPEGVLEEQGPNSRSARRITYTSVGDVRRLADTLRQYVEEAVDLEALGVEAPAAPALELVEELQDRLDRDPALRAAFEALTPGRQREYNLHFSDAKQSATRAARVDKCAEKILAGKGFRDR